MRTLILLVVTLSSVAFAQSDLDKAPKPQTRERVASEKKSDGDQQPKPISDADRQSLRRETQSEEEAAVLPYINNFSPQRGSVPKT